MKIVVLILVLAFGPLASAQTLKVSPGELICGVYDTLPYHLGISNPYMVIYSENDPRDRKVLVRIQMPKMQVLSLCGSFYAAQSQAKKDGSSLVLNPKTGVTKPDLGFYRIPSSNASFAKLSASELKCEVWTKLVILSSRTADKSPVAIVSSYGTDPDVAVNICNAHLQSAGYKDVLVNLETGELELDAEKGVRL